MKTKNVWWVLWFEDDEQVFITKAKNRYTAIQKVRTKLFSDGIERPFPDGLWSCVPADGVDANPMVI